MRTFLCLGICLVLVGCSAVVPENVEPGKQNPAVVLFRNSEGDYATTFHLKYKNQLYAVTARHAVPSQRQTRGEWSENFNDYYVMDSSTQSSSAFLRPSQYSVPFGVLDQQRPRENFPVTVCGFNQNGEYIESKGYVCGRVVCNDPVIDVIYTTATMQAGMSGGPVLDKHGNVIGIVVQRLLPKDGVGGEARSACTPIERALTVMEPKTL